MGLLLHPFPWLEAPFGSPLLPSWLPTSTKLVTTLYLETCDSLSNLVEKQTLDSKVTQRGSEDSGIGTHTQNMMTKAFFP